jgi:TusA-related sulfurtransferase
MATSKCAESPHRAEIDEAAKNGMRARQISEMLTVKYAETISHTSINKYLATGKSIVQEEESKVLEALEARIRNLEINACKYGPNGNDRGWTTYSIEGGQTHSLSRMDVLLDAIPDSEGMEAEFRALQDKVIAKRQKADGLPLNDEEFITQRAENLKAEEEARIAEEEATKKRMQKAAEDEILRIKTDRENLTKVLEESARKQERRNRLDALRDAALEKEAGIDKDGNPLDVQ